jgi:hypothetical protein
VLVTHNSAIGAMADRVLRLHSGPSPATRSWRIRSRPRIWNHEQSSASKLIRDLWRQRGSSWLWRWSSASVSRSTSPHPVPFAICRRRSTGRTRPSCFPRWSFLGLARIAQHQNLSLAHRQTADQPRDPVRRHDSLVGGGPIGCTPSRSWTSCGRRDRSRQRSLARLTSTRRQ